MQRVAALAHRAAAAQRGCQPRRPMPPPECLHQQVANQRPLAGAYLILIQQFERYLVPPRPFVVAHPRNHRVVSLVDTSVDKP
jgi:hypothetical protein